MSVTTDLVKKIVLQYIGGKPVFGNPKEVYAAGKKIVVQKIGSGPLGGTLGSLLNNVTSLSGAMSSLVQNPLGALTSQVSGLAGNLVSQVQGLGLGTGLINQISGAVSGLQSAAQGLLDHTNLISGVTQDLENLGPNLMSAEQIMQIDDSDTVLSVAGSLFKDGQIDAIRQSLDPTVPGGVTDLLNSIARETDQTKISQLVSNMAQTISDHTTTINSIVQLDQTAQAKFLLKQDIVGSVQSIIPDIGNEGQSMVFDRIATDTLKTITTELSVAAEVDTNG